jgi:hypothetical protein
MVTLKKSDTDSVETQLLYHEFRAKIPTQLYLQIRDKIQTQIFDQIWGQVGSQTKNNFLLTFSQNSDIVIE